MLRRELCVRARTGSTPARESSPCRHASVSRGLPRPTAAAAPRPAAAPLVAARFRVAYRRTIVYGGFGLRVSLRRPLKGFACLPGVNGFPAKSAHLRPRTAGRAGLTPHFFLGLILFPKNRGLISKILVHYLHFTGVLLHHMGVLFLIYGCFVPEMTVLPQLPVRIGSILIMPGLSVGILPGSVHERFPAPVLCKLTLRTRPPSRLRVLRLF